MNRTGLHIPKPYPDELLYSVIGRCALHLGVVGQKFLLELLFGTRQIVATVDLPGRLDRLRWCLEDRWQWPLAEAVMALTHLPFYTANRSVTARKRLIRALIRDHISDVHTRLGICATTVPTPSYLRFCPTCCEQDMLHRGETYWRRSHQLPGVVVCAVHGTPLRMTRIPMRPLGRHEFVPLTTEHVESPCGSEAVEEEHRAPLEDIARQAQAWLATAPDSPARAGQADLVMALQAKGYGPDKRGLLRLEHALIARYGRAYLTQWDFTFATTGRLKWLAELARAPRRPLHPLRQIWLEVLIAASESRYSISPFGDGPWPCRNWLADHHGQHVVTEMENFRDHRHPERILARFKCDCGFVYSEQLGTPPHAKPHVIEFGPLFTAEAKKMAAKGYSTRAIATALEVDWKTADHWIRGKVKRAPANPDYVKDQKQWLVLQEAHPGAGVKAIRAQAPALYARLYRNCRGWLKEHSPRQAEPTRVVSRQVDWSARDKDMAMQVNAMADQIRAEDPLRRITRTQIAARLNSRALIQYKLGKLPRTKAVFEAVTETPLGFRLRRLEWSYARHGPEISDEMLLYRARIRKAYVCEGVLEKIMHLRETKI